MGQGPPMKLQRLEYVMARLTFTSINKHEINQILDGHRDNEVAAWAKIA